MNRFVAASSLDRGPLLRALRSGTSESPDLDAWLAALLAVPPDPRVASVLHVLSAWLPLVYRDDDARGDDDTESELELVDSLTRTFVEVCRRHRDEALDARIAIEHDPTVTMDHW